MRDIRSRKSPRVVPGFLPKEDSARSGPLPSPLSPLPCSSPARFRPYFLFPIFYLLVSCALSGCSSRSQDLDTPKADKTEEPASAPGPEEPTSEAANTTTPAAKEEKLCVVGLFRKLPMQRMIQDNGYDSIIEEQSVSGTQVAFAAQRTAWQASQTRGASPAIKEAAIPPAPMFQGLLFAKGREVTDNIPSFIYADTGGKGKPTSYTIEPRDHTYFLIEEAWDCTGQEADVNESRFPFGEPGEKACLPEEIVKKCRAL